MRPGRTIPANRKPGRLLACIGLTALVLVPGLSLAQETPSLEQARAHLHQLTDVECDRRNNPNLIRQDRVVVMSSAGGMSTNLFDLYCDNAGAQKTRVFLVWTTFGRRFRLLHVARPVYSLRYKDEAIAVEIAEPVVVTGFETLAAIPNGKFDPESLTLRSDIPWGQQGDAGEYGQWRWNHATGRFDLASYIVDPHRESNLDPARREAWAGKVIRLFPFGT